MPPQYDPQTMGGAAQPPALPARQPQVASGRRISRAPMGGFLAATSFQPAFVFKMKLNSCTVPIHITNVSIPNLIHIVRMFFEIRTHYATKLLHFFTKFLFCIYTGIVLLFHGICIFSYVNSWIESSVKMPDPDQAVSAVILLGNFLSIARQVSANFSADREQEEMQKITYLRAAVASVLAYSLQNLDTCALCNVHVARL